MTTQHVDFPSNEVANLWTILTDGGHTACGATLAMVAVVIIVLVLTQHHRDALGYVLLALKGAMLIALVTALALGSQATITVPIPVALDILLGSRRSLGRQGDDPTQHPRDTERPGPVDDRPSAHGAASAADHHRRRR